ncbi:MAG: hypothetical protein KA752_12255, partial [Giesbergeria sp.]|nr:hypothetical protein [Giesbergeria sp.]
MHIYELIFTFCFIQKFCKLSSVHLRCDIERSRTQVECSGRLAHNFAIFLIAAGAIPACAGGRFDLFFVCAGPLSEACRLPGRRVCKCCA